MNLYKEIGGYFGLEIDSRFDNISNNIALNCARNCLRYTIKAFNIKEIYVPYYTCPVVWQAIKKENCKINFYHIDDKFMPTINFPENSYILYTNYFGFCAQNVKFLAKKYKNLIIDNSQAFYMPKYGIASFNSIRKFFGVSDGALLQTNKVLDCVFEQDTSYQRFSHLLKRLDVNASFGYDNFCKNDDSLIKAEIKTISNLTKMIFNSIDINSAREKRLVNFNYLNEKLTNKNSLNINLDVDDVPMIYPFLFENDNIRTKLIKNKIYIAQYWSPIPNEYTESKFQKYLLPLPIDQRYEISDMDKILEVLNV